MNDYKTVEDILVWQKSMQLVIEIYRLVSISKLKYDRSLTNQIKRSAVSIPSNISEGYERQTKKEFINFLFIAKGSAAELRTQITIAYKLNYISKSKYNLLSNMCIEVSKMLM